MRCGSKQIYIVGINFTEAVLSRGGQMHGVGCAKERCYREAGENEVETVENQLGQRQPVEGARTDFVGELPQSDPIQIIRQATLADFTMQGRDNFRSSVLGTSDRVRACQLANCFKARIFVIKAHQIAGVQIDHCRRWSRSSEMIWVLSAPPSSFSMIARKRRLSLRRA